MISVQLSTSVAEALVRLRAHAFATDRRIEDVARDVIDRELRFAGPRLGSVSNRVPGMTVQSTEGYDVREPSLLPPGVARGGQG